MAKNVEHESEEIEDEISKLNSLLDNNEPPSSYQIPFINEHTGRLDAYLAKVHARLRKARGEILRYRSILSGIRRLPPEILSEIFVHCMRPIPTTKHRIGRFKTYPNPSPRNALYALSQVCRKWRNVALSTPALWCNLTIAHETPTAHETYSQIIQHCSERSRVSPLYITLLVANFTCLEEEEEEKSKIFVGALNTADKLLRHASRWHYFDFNASWYPYHLAEILFPVLPASGLPNLHEACFSIHTRRRRFGAALWMLQLLQASPNLRRIQFNALVPDIEVAPWTLLQSFEATAGVLLKDLFTILKSCSRLQFCDACLLVENEEDSPSPSLESELVLQNLHTLNLSELLEEELTTVLRCLTLPALRKLSLSGPSDEPVYEWPHQSFIKLLSRSQCHLESLSLNNLAFSADQVINYLCLPNVNDTLEDLEIKQWEWPIPSEVLKHVTFKLPSTTSITSTSSPSMPTISLPKLHSVSLIVHAVAQAVPLRDFVASRWYNIARNDVPLPIPRLKRIQILLAVPFLPNASVSSIETIERVFRRVSLVARVDLNEFTIQPSAHELHAYTAIEKLDEDGFFDYTI
ncbi:uncharacterized protein C8R40DRAFT_720048 [Lentinula edodes]|uniref:uncharacterized protein n=1 Tax=Lentinula edodes TaxID=5353 RepID=UPI001E8DB91A|nr:uncharacterized protein C8R40DRAFT_1154897 [Lentinula edodes]XP_046080807.1 uncharacterized protein C8R40DRAFT_720048 [Lentinula edodes]KAH7869706.1 hypothetical protein C8R40DRAFT_1154897 [Lentinula edodes]KAH7869713.1 hypothetical protein C8R40DRAFT_720048 [Lentinula edodes]